MGKVGSSSVFQSLRNTSCGKSVLSVHFLSPELTEIKKYHKGAGIDPAPYHIYLGEAIRKILKKDTDRSCKIITIVRDPIAIVISDLFQNPYFADESLSQDGVNFSFDKVISYLERKLLDATTFSYIYEWFDRELKRIFDIDVFALPFPKEIGYAFYKKQNTEVLLIRLEDLSRNGPQIIQNFLNLKEPFEIKSSHVRSDLEEGELYSKVKRSIKLDLTLCRNIYSSDFVNHFYSDPMIEQFIAKWSPTREH